MNLISVAIFSLCLGLVFGQSPSCQTLDGKSGECVSIVKCQPLLDLIRKKNLTDEEKSQLSKTHCGFLDGLPKVCCAKQPESAANTTCSTPNGKPGKCISVYSCPHIANMLRPNVANLKENIAYVQNLRCQGSEKYSVCCSPPINATNDELPGSCQAQMTAFPPDPSTECCGVNTSPYNKILGGNATTIDEAPWAVIIEYDYKEDITKLSCGGALISGKYVLTAGHCIAGSILDKATPKVVRLGEYDISHEGPDCMPLPWSADEKDCNDGDIRIAIEKTIPHPMYNPRDPWRRNDIGLIRLEKTPPYTDFIRPICLPTRDLTQPQNTSSYFSIYTIGWGITYQKRGISNVMTHVEMPFVSQEKCQPAYNISGRDIPLWKGQLCAGGAAGKDSCRSDSGGPLVYQNVRVAELIGILSFGPMPCDLKNVPGVFTNVYNYLDWIKSAIVP